MSLLELRDMRTEFRLARRTVHAVNGVCLQVGAGEIVGVAGESGSGKSVMLRSILGLVQPPGYVVGGEIDFGGRDLRAMSAGDLRVLRGAELSYVPQSPFSALHPLLRIERIYKHMLRAHGERDRAAIRDRTRETLLRVGIADAERVMRSRAHELSGGMAQRVVIGLAMMLGPKLMLADEPTTGLDVTVQRQILDRLQRLCREDGRSLMIVTHDFGVVANYCDSIVVMYAGKVIETGQARDVIRSPRHPYTAALLAASTERRETVAPLPGRVPDLSDELAGCRFAPRCQYAEEACRAVEPATTAEGTRSYACYFPRNVSHHAAS